MTPLCITVPSFQPFLSYMNLHCHSMRDQLLTRKLKYLLQQKDEINKVKFCFSCLCLQNVWCWRTEIRKEEVDSLLWRRNCHHLLCSSQCIWLSTGRRWGNGKICIKLDCCCYPKTGVKSKWTTDMYWVRLNLLSGHPCYQKRLSLKRTGRSQEFKYSSEQGSQLKPSPVTGIIGVVIVMVVRALQSRSTQI